MGQDAVEADRWQYLTTDHLGTSLVATDAAQADLWTNRLTPFGEDSLAGTPSGALANEVFLRFPGQWEDPVWQAATQGAGVNYNVYRWYAVGLGRYSRPDPLGLRGSGTLLLYGYGEADPISWSDPLGLCSCDDECPGGLWTYIGYGWKAGLIGGLGANRGFYSCDSNPSARVLVRSTCAVVGVWGGVTGSVDFTFGNIPAACGCNKNSMLGRQVTGYLGAVRAGGSAGRCDVADALLPFTFTGGPALGADAGVAMVTCRIEPWRGWLDAIPWPF